ncbi:MAG: T9SS type A sorting domain-containing protein [Candidatus Hatepunaea meridiana]|nr:T9SS type A sorting domain-containing protein [Candidatus Hatepunaea meridiana]
MNFPSYSQHYENVEPLSEILQTGCYTEIAIEGDRLYAVTGYGFEVLDISNPEEPTLLGRAPCEGYSERIAVKDGYVYLAEFSLGMFVFDARDPGNISQVFNFSHPDYLFAGMQVHENRLYLCVWGRGLKIYDISEPGEPQYLAYFTPPLMPFCVLAHDTLVYVADWYEGILRIVDMRDTDNIEVLSEYFLDRTWVEDMCVSNDILFLAEDGNGLRLLDIEDTGDIQHISSLQIDDCYMNSVTIRDNFAYVGCCRDGLLLVDYSDPRELEIVGIDDSTQYWIYNTEFSGNNAYVAGSWDGLVVYNAADPSTPELLANYNKPPPVYFPTAYHTTLIVPRNDEGLLILNTEDPTNPEVIVEIDSIYTYSALTSDDGWLYLTSFNPEDSVTSLQAWNIDDPEHPEGVWRQDIFHRYGNFRISDDLLYIAYYKSAVALWDISDRGEPSHVADIVDTLICDAYIEEDLLYSLGTDDIFRITDISNPDEPELLGDYEGLNYAYDIVVAGNNAYIADGGDGIVVLGVEDPTEIFRLATAATTDRAHSLAVSDSLLYVCDYRGGLRVFDLLTRRQPIELGFLDTPGNAMFVEVEDGIAYVGDTYDLTICRYNTDSFIWLNETVTPQSFKLFPAFPNPFNSTVTIGYFLPAPSWVNVTIFDLQGRLVYRENNLHQGGFDSFIWNGKGLPSGSYLFRLSEGMVGSSSPEFNEEQILHLVR